MGKRDEAPYRKILGDSPPPHSIEAEMALIGALLIDDDVYEHVGTVVKPEHFYSHVHGRICKVIYGLRESDIRVDKVSVAEALRDSGQLDTIGGLAYLNLLMDTVQTVTSAGYYAIIVSKKFRLRQLMTEARTLYMEALNGDSLGPQEVANTALARIESVAESRELDNSMAASTAAFNLASSFDGEGLMVYETPWAGVNARIGGFAPGELAILGGVPAAGKSGMVNSLAHYMAWRGYPVAQFCLEMGIRPTVSRYAAMLTDIPSRKILQNKLTRIDRDFIITRMSQCFADFPLRLFDRFPGWSVADIRIACRKLKREWGALAAIFIDHVGFLTDVARASGNLSKHERLDSAFKSLLAISAELECAVVAVQHMNREVKDGLPTMFDLRDGGNPEGNAHTIIIPFRQNPQHDDPEIRASGMFIIEKARDGEAGIARAKFWGRRAMWVDKEDPYPWWEARVYQSAADDDGMRLQLEPPPPP